MWEVWHYGRVIATYKRDALDTAYEFASWLNIYDHKVKAYVAPQRINKR